MTLSLPRLPAATVVVVAPAVVAVAPAVVAVAPAVVAVAPAVVVAPAGAVVVVAEPPPHEAISTPKSIRLSTRAPTSIALPFERFILRVPHFLRDSLLHSRPIAYPANNPFHYLKVACQKTGFPTHTSKAVLAMSSREHRICEMTLSPDESCAIYLSWYADQDRRARSRPVRLTGDHVVETGDHDVEQ